MRLFLTSGFVGVRGVGVKLGSVRKFEIYQKRK